MTNKIAEALRAATNQLALIGTPDDAINNCVVSEARAAIPLAEAVPDVVEALRAAYAALHSDVRQPTKNKTDLWESQGMPTDTIYHLNGVLCGNAFQRARKALAAYDAAVKGVKP